MLFGDNALIFSCLIVAKFPLRMAIPSRLLDRTTVFATNEGSFLTASDFDSMVEWHTNGSPENIRAGR